MRASLLASPKPLLAQAPCDLALHGLGHPQPQRKRRAGVVGARGRTYTPATGRSAKPDTTKNLTIAYGYRGLTEASPEDALSLEWSWILGQQCTDLTGWRRPVAAPLPPVGGSQASPGFGCWPEAAEAWRGEGGGMGMGTPHPALPSNHRGRPGEAVMGSYCHPYMSIRYCAVWPACQAALATKTRSNG